MLSIKPFTLDFLLGANDVRLPRGTDWCIVHFATGVRSV